MGIFFSKRKAADTASVDFEAVVEGDETLRSVDAYLQFGRRVQELLMTYGDGCKAAIGKALSARTPEAEAEAFGAVVVRMRDVAQVWEALGGMTSTSFTLFSALSDLTSEQHLAAALARLVTFALSFDNAKARAPQLQNDLAFYKRMLNKQRVPEGDERRVFSIEEMSTVCLALASTTPMMTALVDGLPSAAAAKAKSHALLSSLANVCLRTVRQGRYDSEEMNQFCLRTMVASIILFDRLDTDGAFHKKSPIHTQRCVALLKGYSTDEKLKEGLLNGLRYSTKHLNDARTPASIHKLLA